jgi:hypothetical protein
VAERVDARLRTRTLDRLALANATKAARWQAEAVAALAAEGLEPTPEAVAERVAALRSAHMRWVVSHRAGRAPAKAPASQ